LDAGCRRSSSLTRECRKKTRNFGAARGASESRRGNVRKTIKLYRDAPRAALSLFCREFRVPKYIPGQRWISEAEPELGLGSVIAFESNRVTVLYIASGERRTYAADNAPLARVRFVPGETVESVDGWSMKVKKVEEAGGLLIYRGVDEEGDALSLEEMDLNHHMQFNKPQARLFAGQIDPSAWFDLRRRTLLKAGELERSPVLGLCGARVSLIPHQLYIAHEASNRLAPRVLLADEVGLGKTIEAGLILHHQILTNRAERVLILVPEPLLHQWLVEMLRRFNLRFSLFDDERYYQQEAGNPFLAEQLVLCGLDFFRHEPERRQKALAAGWDLCVVDEAHHLAWSEDSPSEDYLFVEALAKTVPGLLLLTATPEQLGKRSHFARLRLLDPDRFHDFDAFQEEERQYEPLARLVEPLADGAPLDDDARRRLEALLANDRAEDSLARLDDPETSEQAREALVRIVLDRHGVGRVLFRNTRAVVQGFPERRVRLHALPLPKEYLALAEQATGLDDRLYPETLYRRCGGSPKWWRIDPRVRWLVETLYDIQPAKALVICAKMQTAVDLEEALRVVGGVHAAVFHEGLSILARDRAAAWFADEEEGAQALVCSEIGSEGRNFQFAHHLALFDLPPDPDQLEQRIGRLDRIGQRETIRIHIPAFADGAQGVLSAWYHEGLDAFAGQCPAGAAVRAKMKNDLESVLLQPDRARLDALIEATRQLNGEILEALHRGRDRLLELNSCRAREAEGLARRIREAEGEEDLWDYLEAVFDAYGVNVEEHSEHCHILMPGDHMRVSHFPGLPEDGVTVTLDRGIGLAREDMLFLTWEHPLVRGAMDLVVNDAQGNAAFALVRHPDLEAGQLLLETIYRIECAAPKRLRAERHMPQTAIRLLVDANLDDLSHLPSESLIDIPRPLDREEIAALLRGQRRLVERMLARADKIVQERLPGIVAGAVKEMLGHATAELKRLSALRKVNPYVRQEELDEFKRNALELHGHIQASRPRLDAVRALLTA
jgi:ATP-dependent helicase HepA